MKPEEREELKQNDLENWLQYGLPIFMKKYGSYVLLFLACCLLGFQLWRYQQQKKAVEVQNAWNELDAASAPTTDNAPAKLQALISQYQIKPVQALAWLQIATFYTDAVAYGNPPEGYNGVKVNQEEALKQAEDAANHVINEFSDQLLAVGKAHLALATVALDRGDWDAAKKQYELLADKSGPFAETPFTVVADTELKQLNDMRKAPPLAAMAPAEPAIPTTPNGLSGFPGMSESPLPTFEPTTQK